VGSDEELQVLFPESEAKMLENALSAKTSLIGRMRRKRIGQIHRAAEPLSENFKSRVEAVHIHLATCSVTFHLVPLGPR